MTQRPVTITVGFVRLTYTSDRKLRIEELRAPGAANPYLDNPHYTLDDEDIRAIEKAVAGIRYIHVFRATTRIVGHPDSIETTEDPE